MKFELITVGKTVNKHLQALESDYQSRISHYMPFTLRVLSDLKNTKNMSAEEIKRKEGEMILRCVAPTDSLVLLDEHGAEYRSIELAEWLQKKQQSGQNLKLVIGGPYGFSTDVYERANGKLSLSKLTFSHQMVRTICLEQIYRACTIIKGEPYHHE